MPSAALRRIAIVVCLLSSVAASAAETATQRYIVSLSSPAAEVESVAKELAKTHHGTILAVWKHALRGFWIEMKESDAKKLARDRRVTAMETDAPVKMSAVTLRKTKNPGVPSFGQSDAPWPPVADHLSGI